MRLFIAIQFSDDIKKGLISVMHDLKKKNVGGSYSPADNLHLTLAFIGETQNVEGVKRAMEATTFAPFMLSLTDCMTADSKNRQRQVRIKPTVSGTGKTDSMTDAMRDTEQNKKSTFFGSENGFGNRFPR